MEIKYIEEELNSIDKTLVKVIFYYVPVNMQVLDPIYLWNVNPTYTASFRERWNKRRTYGIRHN